MLADVRRRNNAEPNYVSISHYGRADATVSINTVLPGDELVYSTFVYDGTTGSLISEQPPLGKTPSMGASLVGIMYPLHFGKLRGPRVEDGVGRAGHGGGLRLAHWNAAVDSPTRRAARVAPHVSQWFTTSDMACRSRWCARRMRSSR